MKQKNINLANVARRAERLDWFIIMWCDWCATPRLCAICPCVVNMMKQGIITCGMVVGCSLVTTSKVQGSHFYHKISYRTPKYVNEHVALLCLNTYWFL